MESKIFIGCSSESLEMAEYVQSQLQHVALAQVWNQGIFQAGNYVLETLLEIVGNYDFAVFLVTPQDIAEIREERVLIARDNVLFEAGLFFTKLGRKRTLLVAPRKSGTQQLDFHLPADLEGLTLIKYYPYSNPSELPARVAPVCNEIKAIIKKEGTAADASIDGTLKSLSRGPIYMLRHINRGIQDEERLVSVLRSLSSGAGDESRRGWESATRYGIKLLIALGLVETVPGQSLSLMIIISEKGSALLAHERTFQFYREVMELPLVK